MREGSWSDTRVCGRHRQVTLRQSHNPCEPAASVEVTGEPFVGGIGARQRAQGPTGLRRGERLETVGRRRSCQRSVTDEGWRRWWRRRRVVGGGRRRPGRGRRIAGSDVDEVDDTEALCHVEEIAYQRATIIVRHPRLRRRHQQSWSKTSVRRPELLRCRWHSDTIAPIEKEGGRV